jgi:hypothetical protein
MDELGGEKIICIYLWFDELRYTYIYLLLDVGFREGGQQGVLVMMA